MSSYEKQMQWKKATNVKAKKNHDEKSAEETYSFAPVFYTQGSSSTRSRDGNRNYQEEAFSSSMKGKASRSKEDLLPQSNNDRSSKSKPRTHSEDSLHNGAYGGEVGVHSPEGAVSVESAHGPHVHSDEGDGGGYSKSYSGHHRSQYQRSARPGSNNKYRSGGIDEAGEDDRSDPEGSHSHHSREQRARKVVSRNSASDKNRDGEHRGGSAREERAGHNSSRHHSSHSKGTDRHRSHRHSSRHRGASTGTGSGDRNTSYSSDSSRSSTGSSSEDDEAEEPIIELLERERKQWREEREKLIQCIHLQQLELSQRSIAAHDRAADIAKEFARAIECFEERLVSVEGTVQKEIMSIKTIAESLLHAATRA